MAVECFMRHWPVLLLLALCGFSQTAAKRPLTHRDYDVWRSITTPTLSPDGRFLAYGLFPQDGDGEFVLRDLKTGTEHRHKAGAVPQPSDTPDENVEPDAAPLRPAIRISFTADRNFVAFSTFPAKGEKGGKNGLGVMSTSDGQVIRVASVKSFQVPEKGPAIVAYLKEPATPAPAAPATTQPRARRVEFGTDLVVRDLAASTERTVPDIVEYLLTKDGKLLSIAVSSHKPEGNGVLVGSPLTSEMKTLASGAGRYSKLVWDHRQEHLAFIKDSAQLYVWTRGTAQAEASVRADMAGFPAKTAISDRAPLLFSRDGGRLFFGTTPALPNPAKEPIAPTGEQVVADLWHYKDPVIQPMQKARATQERDRSYRAVYHLAQKKFVQLAAADLPTLAPSPDGRYAIAGDDRAYRNLIDYDDTYADFYLVDTETGKRRKLFEKSGASRAGISGAYWSPDGTKVLYYRDSNWHVVSVTDGAVVNITADVGQKFYNELEDRPSTPASYGAAGWTKDSNYVLVYDRFDVWQISADGKAVRNLTDGLGRKEGVQLRAIRVGRDEEDEPGWDAAKPLFLRAESQSTHDTGFWRERLSVDAAPERLLSGNKNYQFVTKAKDADVLVVTASRFNEFPDLRITDSSFRELNKVTNANPQIASFIWGTSELMPFHNADGVPLQAAVFKPENFDPKKKYPLMVYIYERLSQDVNTFGEPKPGTSISTIFYVSNGYLVLRPDIVYTQGAPGQSALKCVLPAIQQLVDKGYVDENAIGIAGHSWGGYQIAYMVTQTKRFKAAEAGAPVANMTSAYNGIRWGTGNARQFQYERTQSRIGGSLWQYPLQYLENSPVFHVPSITTPLLMIANDADDAVPWGQGIEMYLSLRRHGKEAYLFNYNGERHNLRKRANMKDWTVRMQQYFDYNLKGAPKPAWMENGIPYLDRETEKESIRALTSVSDH